MVTAMEGIGGAASVTPVSTITTTEGVDLLQTVSIRSKTCTIYILSINSIWGFGVLG